ncbi:recombinase family protein [Desulfosporosinus lacus]|uniref:Site-specific DNA recombinase n=1 Tax=Desulfosporosinus lacus DSM 15449 TaxID=1121420 RepID=A0A1M5QNW7_9FIRM|nr:recombinase family protein [Desulfosporosinus lacus]SHH15440.1 Site-specific DNA recombinase [Desulfosporosinus lacus DSM 15449]
MASNAAVKKVVTVIPVKPVEVVKGFALGAKKRVAAYCRVSTDLKEQETSFESQVQHYTDTIGKRTDWDLVDIFADDGISGTTTTKRTEFLRMIKECMAGNIDMIITKSISRFARNTEDCLHFVRKLKDKGIAVYFETENIDTLGSGGELLLTILSGMAQDSSRNQSDVTKWGILRQFESGRVLVNTTRFLGYDKNEDGELVINEEQAELVRRVFREYLEGKSYNAIAKGLTKDKIKTITGKDKWWDSTISGMLENEKYHGAALLQKTITVNFLTHKRTPNKGQSPKYMIDENHLPIIDKEIFDKVQDEKERRALLRGNLVGDRHKYSNKYPFSAKVFCGDCGNIFKRRQWNSTNTSKKVVWQCKTYIMDGKDACKAKAVDESVLMDAFVRTFNGIYENKQSFIKTLTENIEMIILQRPEGNETETLDNRIEKLKNELKRLIRFQVNNSIDSEVYNEEYRSISEDLEEVRKKRLEHERVIESKDGLKQRFDEILDAINSRDSLLEEFDEEIFNAMVEKWYATLRQDSEIKNCSVWG